MKKLLAITFIFYSINLFAQFSDDINYFPITHHIITKDDGTGGIDSTEIPVIMSELNRAFLPARIQFYMSCVGIKIMKK